MFTEGILNLRGMKQSLSFLVVLTFVDKLMASCANNCGSANLRFGFSLKPKKKKIIYKYEHLSGSLDKLQSVNAHEK